MDKTGPVKQQSAPDAASVLMPALKFGAYTGSAGFVVGGIAGVIRETPAIFFATASGIQWFGLGATFWGSRSFILQAWDTGKGPTQSERVSASTIAGGVAGSGIGLLSRGPRNVLPGGIMFSLFGFIGQHAYDIMFEKAPLDSATAADKAAKGNLFERIAARKWSPFSVLTDKQYEDMLNEKLLRLEADIALIDDRIAELRVKEKEWAVTEAEKSIDKQVEGKKV
ncbi:hypothetical protein BDV97DRAFT_371884 [Delphinella strobiligena]|nr:hypothetical protein BDV97DRAFT_371884 [Delphinella strobiligena]